MPLNHLSMGYSEKGLNATSLAMAATSCHLAAMCERLRATLDRGVVQCLHAGLVQGPARIAFPVR